MCSCGQARTDAPEGAASRSSVCCLTAKLHQRPCRHLPAPRQRRPLHGRLAAPESEHSIGELVPLAGLGGGHEPASPLRAASSSCSQSGESSESSGGDSGMISSSGSSSSTSSSASSDERDDMDPMSFLGGSPGDTHSDMPWSMIGRHPMYSDTALSPTRRGPPKDSPWPSPQDFCPIWRHIA